ncbi:dihydroorotate oxidase B, catalytic subunit [Carboxydocella sporoproducens DSM 16521]|uniref:Dihydroorotate dehydrogenase n=2 Tax=Carboxydocella TaxID=178898 RepID=A0A1T4MXY7_9FIRM|nr:MULTISPECIES: dihydroorotate dehydrogenase [Carboxydocella]AVX20285.1 dihydroorotate dehydrogenase (NAD+) catalytic subunit [Carboxydocella thermautotrophica]AVX30709.1 dihydroorotate dehydrogenase (NAD+) catalytic subunit [Carboxydocella thermautotrophica]SJZ71645.1 dihydroorotate oxidase B, catalytic subunit [Carboxydocella sporoproducens DSM 16521]
MTEPNLTTSLGALQLANPVLTASGTCGFGLELTPFGDLNQLGGVILKGTTLTPRAGNPTPRLAETPAGVLNAIGLENPGIEGLCRDVLPRLTAFQCSFLANISGNTVEEYGELAARLEGEAVIAAIEVNVSCPNVKQGGIMFGTQAEALAEVTRTVKAHTTKPVIIKLTPNVTDIVALARAAAEAGADALSLINTLQGMAIDIRRRRPVLANIFGGLAGPAIKPVALRCVWQVHQALPEMPLLGGGGIMSGEDAIEFFLAGASAVSIGTATLVDPRAPWRILAEIEEFCRREGVRDLGELIGAAHRKEE